jgi:predicted RNase H-like nuclease (RuvC/YqgF family)
LYWECVSGLDNFSDISRLLEEKELLQQQVQQLQEEIRVQASGEQYDSGRTTCTYVEKQVVSMQMIANEKDKEISSLQEQLQQIRQSFDQRQPTSCVQNRRLERYSNRRVAFKGNYTFPVKSIPKLRYDEPETMEHLLQGVLYSLNFLVVILDPDIILMSHRNRL